MKEIKCSCGHPISKEEFFTMGHQTEDGEESVEWGYECENCKREFSGYEWTDYLSNEEILECIESELEDDKLVVTKSDLDNIVLPNGSIDTQLNYANLAKGSRSLDKLFPTQQYRKYE